MVQPCYLYFALMVGMMFFMSRSQRNSVQNGWKAWTSFKRVWKWLPSVVCMEQLMKVGTERKTVVLDVDGGLFILIDS